MRSKEGNASSAKLASFLADAKLLLLQTFHLIELDFLDISPIVCRLLHCTQLQQIQANEKQTIFIRAVTALNLQNYMCFA